jgi:hypothetical protein
MNGGSVSGKFASVTGGFSADYSKETASPPYFGMIYRREAERHAVGGQIEDADGQGLQDRQGARDRHRRQEEAQVGDGHGPQGEEEEIGFRS